MQPIEIKFNRYSYLIGIPFILALMFLFYWFTIANPDENFTGSVRLFLIVTLFVEAVGIFLIIYFLKQFFNPPVVFRMNNEGIVYNPAGVSTGIIKWEEIDNVEEAVITVYRNGTAYENVLAISLKDPEAFRQRYNVLFQKALQLGEKRYHASVLIEPGVLGKKYSAVKEEIKQRVPFTLLK
jgi:hypothetical protein